ncbi:hypothetical protein Tco_0490702 [Tanacetum coccineum]
MVATMTCFGYHFHCRWPELAFTDSNYCQDVTFAKHLVHRDHQNSGSGGGLEDDLLLLLSQLNLFNFLCRLQLQTLVQFYMFFIQKMQRTDDMRYRKYRSMADLLNSPKQNYTEASKNAVEVLKSDVSRLERQAELSELELESLHKHILKENFVPSIIVQKIVSQALSYINVQLLNSPSGQALQILRWLWKKLIRSKVGMVDAKAVVIKLADRLHIKMMLDALSLSNLNSYTT